MLIEENEDKTLSKMTKLFQVIICAIYERLNELRFSFKLTAFTYVGSLFVVNPYKLIAQNRKEIYVNDMILMVG